MEIKITPESFFIFDLDDTLFPEIDFLKSGYRHISQNLLPLINTNICEELLQKYYRKENAFQWLLCEYGNQLKEINLEWLLKEYREHIPNIKLNPEAGFFLDKLSSRRIPVALITDGRSITQRNKLTALGISHYFSDIIISEEFGSAKPDEKNYLYFEHKYPGKKFCFVGDNTSKDFIVPNKLGWKTICIRNSGNHIHEQSFNIQEGPDHVILSFNEINLQ
jgi:putative hydrolase of the HAD superfamily